VISNFSSETTYFSGWNLGSSGGVTRLLNSLSFSSYSLIEVLKLKNLYKEEGTPIKVVVLDKEGKEYDYFEIQKELEKFI